jgi:multicomponent Na+:H+ antiporter subunit D
MYKIHPGFLLIICGLLTLILPKKAGKYAGLAGSLLSFAACVGLETGDSWTVAVTERITCVFLRVDALSRVFALVFAVVSVLAALYAINEKTRGERAALLIYAGGGLSAVLAGDLIGFVCFWELMAAASAAVVWLGDGADKVRSSFRYLVMHLFGGNLVLIGAMLLWARGITQVEGIRPDAGAAFWVLLAGIAINAAMPPFHTWLPDSYPECTPEGMLYLGSFTTKVAIYAMIRFFGGTHWLALFGALTAVFAACMALMENDLRRLLSYHIISQLGMMVAGLATGLEAGLDGAALHAAFNILYKGVLIMGIGNLYYATGGLRKITDLAGMGKKLPFTFGCFLTASLAIAGFPFLNGFASKALIMEALKASHMEAAGLLVTAAGVGTWLSVTMKINWFVFLRKPKPGMAIAGRTLRPVPAHRTAAMGAGTALCVITGIFPQLCYGLFGLPVGHLFSAAHILEYLGLFLGASVPFVLLIRRMEPHEGMTVDLDVIWRKGLTPALWNLSRGVTWLFARAADLYDGAVALFEKLTGTGVRSRVIGGVELGEEEDRQPLGHQIQVIAVLCILAVLFLIFLEAV